MDEAKRRTARIYNAASDHYDDAVLSFWQRFGHETVDRIGLTPGSRVLDVCSGTGASAIAAAQAIGPTGRVVAVDLADRLIAMGRARATELGLTNIEFRPGDFEDMELSSGGYDAAICVFGIFFLPDMARGLRSLWRAVKPGGCLAVTTWGPRAFEPANGAFWQAVRTERPELFKASNSWDRIVDPESILALFQSAGIEGAVAEAVPGTHPVHATEDWWTLVMGSEYRGTVELLTPEQRERVRHACESFVRRNSLRAVELNVVYATARKP
jgi:ubiquinone/menaquinone biosynthesis C-methylase UbiE